MSDTRRYDVHTVRMALAGEVGAWMEHYNVSRETAIYELQRLAAETQRCLSDNRAWRLERLEEALEIMQAEAPQPDAPWEDPEGE